MVLDWDGLRDIQPLATAIKMKPKKRKAAKEFKPPTPACNCECVRCDLGAHCGKKPDCEWPTWRDWKTKPAAKFP